MLILLDEQKNTFHIFNHYGGLYNHIETYEKQKYAKKARWKAQSWIFARHSHRRMMTYQGIFSSLMSEPTSRGVNGWDILEVVSGNPDNPVFIPLAHNVDVEPLQQNWCRKYCEAHDYTLIEVADIRAFKKMAGNFKSEKLQE
jgi:hypothetical protein